MGDLQSRTWRGRKSAIRWVYGQGRRAVAGVEDNHGDEGGEVECTLAVASVPNTRYGEEQTLSNLVDATITLFGVRDTWAYLGPRHRTCRPSGAQFPKNHEEPRPAEFWWLITAAYQGDVTMVRYLLEDGEMSSVGLGSAMTRAEQPSSASMLDEKSTMLDDWSARSCKILAGTSTIGNVAAALTVAIRRGHRDIVSMLLRMDPARSVRCDVRFWNGRTVIGALSAATANGDPKVAELAVDTVRRVVGEWQVKEFWVQDRRWCVEHMQYALDIPTSSNILQYALWSLLTGPCHVVWDQDLWNRPLFHLLCQAVLTNDVKRARVAVEILASDTDKVVKKFSTWSNEDGFLLNPCNVRDESGVRTDRLMDVMNAIRIAGALSHYEILEWLLGEGWELQEEVKLWRLTAREWTERDPGISFAKKGTLYDTRHEAVYNTFLDRRRLPACVRPISDFKILEMILRELEGLCWDQEIIISAGTQNIGIFGAFMELVDLSKRISQKVHRVKGNLFVEGAHARTIGEKSLQHALKAGRFDNTKILLMKGVKLAEAIRSDGFYHDDPEAMAILKGLQKMELPGLSVVSRTMQVLYWVDGDVRLRLGQTKTIEENEKWYVWKNGQKVRRIGAPTFRTSR